MSATGGFREAIAGRELAAAGARRELLQSIADTARAIFIAQAASIAVLDEPAGDFVFEAVAGDRFYIYSHPHALSSVQTRLEDIMQSRNPTDPFAARPEIGIELRKALRAVD